MKITHITIRNYRCLKDIDLPIDNYTAFVGANGSGKSSVLYALNWFFNGGGIDSTDVHGYDPSDETATDESEKVVVEVSVTFSELTDRDRARLGHYGRGDTAVFRRSWAVGDSSDKVVGNAKQGPGFAAIRAMKLVGELRPAYENLRTQFNDLPDLGRSATKDQIEQALANWESESVNQTSLEDIEDSDANHMFGINGQNVIKDCVRMVLIPAATDLASEIGGPKKGSAINELIGTLTANAGAAAKQAWIENNSTAIDQLTQAVRASIQESTGFQAERINERLANLVPGAELSFSSSVPSWVPSPTAQISTEVTIDGATNNVAKQGHGIQRAVMIAMFQSLVPDVKLIANQHEVADGETQEQAEERLQEVLADLPAIVICIEEPEIYQHPVRARAFAKVLSVLADQANAQVILATHSPYFITPSQFTSLRRFSLTGGETTSRFTDLAKVATAANCNVDKVEKIVEKRLPTTFSEGFFADAVVLVEGDTDKVVLEVLADKLGTSFDAAGVSVLEMSGKEGLSIPNEMMKAFGVPTYMVVDGDALGAARKHAGNSAKILTSHQSHKRATESILALLPQSDALHGALPYAFEDSSVITKHYTIWEDDIEEELSKWPSFMTALGLNGGILRSKDLLVYRTAVLDADTTDCPEQLRKCIEAILSFVS